MPFESLNTVVLVAEGRKDEAFRILEEEISREPDLAAVLDRGTARMFLGEMGSAISDFLWADQIDRTRSVGRTGAALLKLGVAYWMVGRQRDACASWLEVAEGLEKRFIKFADAAGGIGAGALLWFGGSIDSAFREKAERFLKKHGFRSRAESWPGPIGQFLLGRKSAAALEAEADSGVAHLTMRRLCQALFYVGVMAREADDVAGARSAWQRARDTGIYAVMEKEYYLSRHELSKLEA